MKQKNVLMIVVDQWRGDTLPMLDHPVIKTPNIQALAALGVTFAKHYTQAVPCGPGRASLLTGQYMMNHRAVQNTIPLDARHTNIALEVRKAGYDPALVGYTTTTPDPRVTAAQDPRFKVLGADMEGWRPVGSWGNKMEAYFSWVAGQGFPMPENPWDIWLPQDLEATDIGASAKPSRIPAELSDTVWFTDRALDYLRGTEHKSWFLHLGYYRPHPPFAAPAPYHAMYDPQHCPSPVRAASAELEAAQHPVLDFYLRNTPREKFFQNGQGAASEMSDAEVRQLRATYYGLMSEIDDQLGRVFDYLKQTGQWDNTLIVFTSDHGEQLGDHHLLGKVGYFDESFHIPMVVRDPSAAADATRGTLVSAFTETIDTMPTILKWLGQEVPRSCDGESLLPFVHHGATPVDWREEVHYEYDFRNIFYSKPEEFLGLKMDQCALAVVQDKAYKYVHFAALAPLFFDLKKDPEQLHNQADNPHYATLILQYAQKMLNWRLSHAERTLTGFAASPEGLQSRP
ncbi:Multifunctional alkaline phosphatase superfamily protein [Polaromonas vacuolata]|uniref:Multifunctional alkaline phosphatase superfamily protein n=1 Tax=Polaromonas vacuolata TaxID=37448 RepID=A0A6H2HDJ3_9BURK|nr:phosphoric/sulfuric ester hydrolase PehA [Polaromonas vacuolata]QJC57942.1 Multifunctional alkaline phosphatase superfamily protein [Polaromonas vacuolata]